jgi:tetratricopeptide (TPR) repeat protein
MLVPLAAALALTALLQAQAADRANAEKLARDGQTAEAMQLFEQIIERDPHDVEARLWLARLELRIGRTTEAEAGFRAVLQEHPNDVDARIGLGTALTRTGDIQGAVALLAATEADVGENAELLGALAGAYRRAGDDRRALEYLRRAHTLAPGDPDLTSAYEDIVRDYGHWISLNGFGQGGAPGTSAGSGAVATSVRVTPRLRLEGFGRGQEGSGYSDYQVGGGVLWRPAHNTTLDVRLALGPGNTKLAESDARVEVVHYSGPLDIGGGLRTLTFPDADVVTGSPLFAWQPSDHWRLDSRYTLSWTFFNATAESSINHSVLLRETWQGWRRVALQGSYAYGIESFEDLTADRLGSLGATTVAAGIRVDTPFLTRITTTWEHQWRSNSTTIDRIVLSVVRSFP